MTTVIVGTRVVWSAVRMAEVLPPASGRRRHWSPGLEVRTPDLPMVSVVSGPENVGVETKSGPGGAFGSEEGRRTLVDRHLDDGI